MLILKLIGSLKSTMMYDDVDFPLSGFAHQFESEKAVSLKRSCLQVIGISMDPAKESNRCLTTPICA